MTSPKHKGLRPGILYYLGSPYSAFPQGIDQAYTVTCKLAAMLVKKGISVYSPIVHTHPIALAGNINPLDHAIWMPIDRPFMERADALIVAKLDGWDKSRGLKEEIETFAAAKKPILYLNPYSMEIEVTSITVTP